jgi:hypothetical protein
MKLTDIFEAQRPLKGGDKPNPWASCKWAPKSLKPDDDLIKTAYNSLFTDAFKTFPQPLKAWFQRRGFGVGGNTIFDMGIDWSDFGEPFEEMFCEPHGDPYAADPDQMYADLVELGKVMTNLQANIEKMKIGYDKFQQLTKTNKLTLSKVQRAYKAQQGLQLTVFGDTIEFFSFDGGHSGAVLHEPMPVFMHDGGKHNRYSYKPSRIPNEFDTDWYFDFVWDKLTIKFGLFEILTDRVLTARTKIKVVPQPTQPTEEDLRMWFTIEE